MEFDSVSDIAAAVTLELSTESVRTIEQSPAYSLQSFLGDIGGNIGIFFGYSVIKVQFFDQKLMTSRQEFHT